MTDCDILLGKLQPRTFPSVFGPGADQPLDAEVVRARFEALRDEIDPGRPVEEIAEGFLRIAARTWPTPSRRSASSAATT